MKVFVGLGNIGSEYAATRHNIGFEVVDRVEAKLERSTGWKAGKGDYYMAKGFWRGEEILLVKPTTYMNLSGRAVQQVLAFFKASAEDMVVITDDIALAVGTLRLRLRGSDGGHNGLSSIIEQLGSNDYARLRCGVGADFRKGEQAKYVLSRFKEAEVPHALEMVEKAVQGLLYIAEKGTALAMNLINGKPPEKLELKRKESQNREAAPAKQQKSDRAPE